MRSKVERRKAVAIAAAIALAAGAAAGCGSGSSGATANGSAGSGGGNGKKHVNIAMFVVATANTHQQGAIRGAKAAVAEAGNATIHVFGANFVPKTQVNQVQDAIASGQYDALLIDSVDGTVMIPAIRQALAKNIKVACAFSICGPDQLKFSKQIDGVVGQYAADYRFLGNANVGAIAKACGDKNPCKVVYMDGTPTLAADVSYTKGWYEAIKKYPNLQVVAKGEGQFAAGPAAQAMKDIIQAHPDIDAVGSVSDQEITGVAQALQESPLKDKKVILVGDGGSELAVKGINSGVWYGSTLLRPFHEGSLGAKALIAAVRGEPIGDTLVNTSLSPDIPTGYVSKETVAKWHPEWAG
jgi:ribose transport system substrate-binding protein